MQEWTESPATAAAAAGRGKGLKRKQECLALEHIILSL